jgi:hypothetical protein
MSNNLHSLGSLANEVSSGMSKDLPTGKTPKRPMISSSLSKNEVAGPNLSIIREDEEYRMRHSSVGTKRRLEEMSVDETEDSMLLKTNERILNGTRVVKRGRFTSNTG